MEIRYWFQAAGLQYEDYRHSPIYRAHCVTANFMARCLRDRGERLNAWMPDNAASRFRMLRSHRTDGANALRRQVAAMVRAERRRIRQYGHVMRSLPPEANSAYLSYAIWKFSISIQPCWLVDAEKIVSRYHKTHAFLPHALALFDQAWLFDNSLEPELVLQKTVEEGLTAVVPREQLPAWANTLI